MYKLTVLVGSLRKDSINKKLALGLAELGSSLFKFDFLELAEVPMFCEELENAPPPCVARLKKTVLESDALFIVTPEYNRSMPALVKNTLDWCSRPPGQSVLAGKPVGIAGMSIGAVGTAVCQAQLRSLVAILGMRHMAQPELYLQYNADFFDGKGSIASERTRSFLNGFLNSFADWIKTQKPV